MSNPLPDLIDEFAGLHVLVLGEAMLDRYLYGLTERLCREAPVPVVDVSEQQNAPGGAANTAVNVASLGANVSFLSVAGQDQEGVMLCQALQQRGVAVEHLMCHPSRRTLAKNRIVAGAQMVVRYDQGSTAALGEKAEAWLIGRLEQLFPRCDALIVSDYGYGILTPRVVQAIARLQARSPRLLAVDAKDLMAYRDAGVTVVKPNYAEGAQLLGIATHENGNGRIAQVEAHAGKLLRLTGAEIAAWTLDKDGALLFEHGSPPYRTYAQPQPDSHAAGAGDTFISALTLALAAGARTHNAADLASAAAGVVVGRDGTTACTIDELRHALSTSGKRINDRGTLRRRVELHRKREQRIVFTNGCFDILHRGHITYLNRAKALGDVLIVGLNDDDSVRRLKGSRRPINPLDDRAQVLEALSCVDYIVPFSEDTPSRLIEVVRPDIFVKGGDYTRETLPEAPLVEELGGEVHILSYLENFSTTSIIERIREAYVQPENGRVAVA